MVTKQPPSTKAQLPEAMQGAAVQKPWKKHNNRHKKEKIRRTVPSTY